MIIVSICLADDDGVYRLSWKFEFDVFGIEAERLTCEEFSILSSFKMAIVSLLRITANCHDIWKNVLVQRRSDSREMIFFIFLPFKMAPVLSFSQLRSNASHKSLWVVKGELSQDKELCYLNERGLPSTELLVLPTIKGLF